MIAIVSQKADIVFSVRCYRLLDCFRYNRALFHSATNTPEPFLIQLLYRKCHVPGCHQGKLFRIPVFAMQWDNFGNRQISVTNNELFAGSNAMEERAKPILQLRDIHGAHMAIIAISWH